MTVANNFLAREIEGQLYYKSSRAWEYRFVKAIADLKVFGASNGGSDQGAVLSLTASRTTVPAHGGVYVDLDLSGLTASSTWWRECEIIWDYGNSGEVFRSAVRSEYSTYLDDENMPDYMGRQARFSKGHAGATVYKKPGTYNISVFVFDTTTNNWAEASVEITVVDPLSLYSSSNTFVVATDGDFTGAPPSDPANQYTDPVAAIDAIATFDNTSALFLKSGDSFRATTFPTGLIRQDNADFYFGTWENGKDVWEAGRSTIYLDSSGRDDLIRVRDCNSFTVANWRIQGFYNPHASETITIDGETIQPGMVGGTNNNAENFGFYFGYGGNVASLVPCRNVTLSNVENRNTQYVRIGSVYNFIFHDCDLRDWSSFGIFAEWTDKIATIGCLKTVPKNCQEVSNQARDLSVRPLAPLHGGSRFVVCPDIISYGNITTARSGWFGADSGQPADRYSTMVNQGIGEPDEPRISVFNEYCIGGDVAFIMESANPTIDTYPCKWAIFDGVVVEATKQMYDGVFRMSYGNTIMRNCVAIIPKVAKQGFNQCWHAIHLWRNGGPTDSTVNGTLSQILAVDASTVTDEVGWPSDYDIALQSTGSEWVVCVRDQSRIWNLTFDDTQTEAAILALDASANDGQVYEASDTGKAFYAVGGFWIPFRVNDTPLSDYNGTVPSIYATDFYTAHTTVINKMGVQSSTRAYEAYRNRASFTDATPAFTNAVDDGLLDYVEAKDGQDTEANILALDPVANDGQAWWATDTSTGYFAQGGAWVAANGDSLVPATSDPQFDDQLVPQSGATGSEVSYRRLDLYMNVVSTSTPKLGAIENGAIY